MVRSIFVTPRHPTQQRVVSYYACTVRCDVFNVDPHPLLPLFCPRLFKEDRELTLRCAIDRDVWLFANFVLNTMFSEVCARSYCRFIMCCVCSFFPLVVVRKVGSLVVYYFIHYM